MLSNSIEILSLNDISCFDEVDETETTLEGNAKLKADYITHNFGYNCFADDTGLEVESLDGKPGVYSARFAGELVWTKIFLVTFFLTSVSESNKVLKIRDLL